MGLNDGIWYATGDGRTWRHNAASSDWTVGIVPMAPTVNTNTVIRLATDATVAVPAPQQRKEEKMRGLYEVFVVDPDTEDVRLHVFVIAADEAKARLKAVQKGLRESLLTDVDELDDFDFIVCRKGDVQPKSKPQEVRVVKE